MSDNVTVINGGGVPSDVANLVRMSNREFENLVQLLGINAKLHRAKFKALVDEGFSESQALELCKTIF